jgi:hypothetical protein
MLPKSSKAIEPLSKKSRKAMNFFDQSLKPYMTYLV